MATQANAQVRGSGAPPLGNIRNMSAEGGTLVTAMDAVTEFEEGFERRHRSRRSRWDVRHTIHDLYWWRFNHGHDKKLARECVCGLPLTIIRPEDQLNFEADPSINLDGHGHANFGNLAACGCVWTCPVCSRAIRVRRASEIEQAQKQWEQEGGHCYMLTLTLSHKAGESIHDVASRLIGRKKKKDPASFNGAWVRFQNRRLWNCKPDEKNPFGGFVHMMGGPVNDRIGLIKAVEVKYGKNGWHVHLHMLIFARRGLCDECLVMVEAELAELWSDVVASVGGEASLEHGLSLVRMDRDGSGSYLAKEVRLGFEVASQDTKKGTKEITSLNPFDLVDADPLAVDCRKRLGISDKQAVALWFEFVAFSRGRHLLDWGPKLKDYFGIVDTSDQELADDGENETDINELIAYVEKGLYKEKMGPRRPGVSCDFLKYITRGDWDKAAELIGARVDRGIFPMFVPAGDLSDYHTPHDLTPWKPGEREALVPPVAPPPPVVPLVEDDPWRYPWQLPLLPDGGR